MVRNEAKFGKKEILNVLSNYDLGKIEKVSSLKAGSRQSPKKIISSTKGVFLLKRRSTGKNELDKVVFAHNVIQFLYDNHFPVAKVIPTLSNETIVSFDENIYEMFEFIEGARFRKTRELLNETGCQLGRVHNILNDYNGSCEYYNCFHDSETVRNNLKVKPQEEWFDSGIAILARDLLTYYNDSASRVNDLGFNEWDKQIIHGDLHPGNLLFNDGNLRALLDFDSVKYASPVTELANACLQFSIVAGRPNPKDWPDYLDQQAMIIILEAYQLNNYMEENKLTAVVDLMIETMIAEAILPVAATGYFAHFSGKDFLEMILRKCDWISKNRENINNAVLNLPVLNTNKNSLNY